MIDLVTIHVVGKKLKCDAPDCDHIEKISEITAAMIGKPCPKCGASLLTTEDFIAGKTLVASLEAVAGILFPVDPTTQTKISTMSLNPHNGGMTIIMGSDNEAQQ